MGTLNEIRSLLAAGTTLQVLQPGERYVIYVGRSYALASLLQLLSTLSLLNTPQHPPHWRSEERHATFETAYLKVFPQTAQRGKRGTKIVHW